MPATAEISSDLLTALRSGGFAGELRFAVDPNAVVFQATVNQTITGSSFIQFAWDGLLEGDYGDVVAGMTFFITTTDDPIERRAPLLRGRVSQDPSGTIFYCNESAINLTDGMIVTVIATFEILQMDRNGNLVDGFRAFQDNPPLVKNMKSFYYVEDATEGQFSFVPVGQAMADGATITAYHWTIAGATYDTGTADTQAITVTVPYGHTWAYLDVTDSNATSFRFIFQILVCLRDDTAFMFTAHDDVEINGSIENGWSCTTTFFAGVESLLNRTRCAIVAFDVPKAGDADLWPNVAFVGYIVQENTDITGDAGSSTLAQTRFELQSFASIAGQLPVPSLPVRNDATPDAWGDIKLPTPQRTIGYLLSRYSTLANLCAIDMLVTDATWFAGEMDLEEGTLLDSINRIGQEIQARLVFWPQGDATFEINGNFLPDAERDALPTLLAAGDLATQDLYSYSLPIPYYKTVGQVRAGCATFYADGSTPFKLDALAPATARQEGNEKPVILAQLLQADLSQADAKTAAKQRIGDLLEYLNPPTNLPVKFKDGFRLLTPSTRTWLTFDLPATDSTRGLPVEPAERWQLHSVTLGWNVENGYWDVSGSARKETRGGLAQTSATISPNVVDTSVPILPILGDYDAFPPDSSINYPTTSPLDADLQPYDPYDLSQYEPMTTEDAAAVADNTPSGDCALVSPVVNFASNVSRTTPRATVVGQVYTATVKGSARISDGGTTTLYDFTAGEQGFSTIIAGYAIYHPGEGWGRSFLYPGRAGIQRDFPGETITGFTITLNEASVPYFGRFAGFNDTSEEDIRPLGSSTIIASGLALTNGLSFEMIQVIPEVYTPLTATVRFTSISVTTEGGGAEPQYADAFYVWNLDEDGKRINVGLNPSNGLLLNGSPLAVPPEYNENGEYTFTYIGDGNPTPFVFYDTNYNENQNLPLYIKVCGPNMGS